MPVLQFKNQHEAEKFVKNFFAVKVVALTAILRIAWRPRTEEQAQKNRLAIGDDIIASALIGLVADDRTQEQRAAFAAILDLVSLDWRDVASPEILGPIIERNSPEVRRWRREVFERDGYECRRCGSEDDLHAHHIVRWVDAPELRIVVANGETLCETCHHLEHGSRAA